MDTGILTMRKPLPDRRKSFTQKVRIDGQVCYLTVGMYEDGTPGEIFVDIAKGGTFVRGIMGTCARAVSIALQSGADLSTILHMLRGHDYPPHGEVIGSPYVTHCVSVMDWVAAELEAQFLTPAENHATQPGQGGVPEKIAGRISESWRTGA